MFLLQNIIENYKVLRADFVGFTLNFGEVFIFILNIFLTLFIFLIFYLIGKKLTKRFVPNNRGFIFFVNIACGYILIGTGIGLLGIFSLLQPIPLLLFFIGLILFAFYPFRFDYQKLVIAFRTRRDKIYLRQNLTLIAVLLFVFISFLRLMTPEITEDAYHTDLPRLYLITGTTLHESKDPLHVIPYPQLAEMIYVIPIFLENKELARFIHFGFYLLLICLLYSIAQNKKSSFAKYAPLLFVTAPVVIRYAPTQYIDFFMVFSFLLSALLIKKNPSEKSMLLSGIILGSAWAVKIWTIAYLPAILIYIFLLNKHLATKRLRKLFITFIFAALLVPLLWYIRDYLLTGNPIYPFFSNLETKEIVTSTSLNYLGFNWNMFHYANLIVLSPLFFVGIVFSIFYYRQFIKLVKQYTFFIFFIALMFEQLIIKVDLGRYLVGWYTITTIFISAGIVIAIQKSKVISFGLISIYIIMFSYYFINTLFILPYGWGWADTNAYLTRVLGRDNASYYDFDRLFNKHISEKDFIATYGIYGYYYADFMYLDVGYIFDQDNRSFDLLKKRNVTKLLIKGGDIEWFCQKLSLKDCDKKKVKLLATYPVDIKKYNLYEVFK